MRRGPCHREEDGVCAQPALVPSFRQDSWWTLAVKRSKRGHPSEAQTEKADFFTRICLSS